MGSQGASLSPECRIDLSELPKMRHPWRPAEFTGQSTEAFDRSDFGPNMVYDEHKGANETRADKKGKDVKKDKKEKKEKKDKHEKKDKKEKKEKKDKKAKKEKKEK